ncbi:c4c6c1ff-eb33-4e17-b5f7-31896ebfa42a [Thermothielavioides terrestris]|uniref:C4c6c1ff-eb33-4e17-b5f7-31896ebfa42a n=1 Tax=Thermothielavioides terrestris TaxID=2587410 RepID=A0A446BDU4_9PEZI|nr:c4c6c1ff-eb33-4e17-b5f7-31896ebfa42a [Thermothielavioides terrestris]
MSTTTIVATTMATSMEAIASIT